MSLKLGRYDWAYKSEELINFRWGNGSLFNFTHHCGIVDFRRFISISHTVTGRF